MHLDILKTSARGLCQTYLFHTKKVLYCLICAGTLTTAKDIQDGPDTRCWAGPTQCACRTPDKVCVEAGHLSCISSRSCHPRLIWLKEWQRLAMVIRTWTFWKWRKHAEFFCWIRSYGVVAAWLHVRNCSGTLTESCTMSENKLEGLWPLSDAHPRTMWTQDFVLKGLNAEGVSVVFGESVFVLLRSR